jgi:hypothetical protein
VDVSEHVYDQNLSETYFLCIPRHHDPANLVSNFHPFILQEGASPLRGSFCICALGILRPDEYEMLDFVGTWSIRGRILLLRRHGMGQKPYEVEYIQLWNDLPHPVRQSVEGSWKGEGRIRN